MPGVWCIVFVAVFAARLVAESFVKPRAVDRRSDKRGKASLAVLSLAFIVSGVAVALYLWRGAQVIPIVYGLGMLLFAAGFAGRIAALKTLGRSFSLYIAPAPSEALRTNGVYGVIRHPIYAFYILETAGLALCCPNWISVVALAIVVPISVWRLTQEERALLVRYGKEYEDYMKRTRRLVPGVY